MNGLRNMESNAGASGDASGAGYSNGFLRQMGQIQDKATGFLRGLRSRSANDGDASGSSFGDRFANALRRAVADKAAPKLSAEGKKAADSFNNAVTSSISRMRIDFPDFGGRLGAKILAILPIIGVLGGAIAALGGGFLGLVGVVGQASVALGALPGILGGVIATVLAGVVAFGGVSEAYKSLGKNTAAAGKNSIAAARQHEQAARQIEAAEEQVISAQEKLAESQDAVVEAQERVIDAQKRVVDARRDLSRAFEDAARSNADAARDVANAERDLIRAVNDEKTAQLALRDARDAARESLEDAAFSARGAALNVEESTMRLDDARKRLQDVNGDVTATDRQRAEASLAFRQAQLAYDEAIDRRDDANKAQAEAVKNGVEGSDQVVSAQEKIAAAHQARLDAIQQLKDAERDQVRTAEDNARRIEDAQQGVTDALEGVADANDAVAEAQKNVGKAARDLQRAMRDLTRAKQDAKTAGDQLSTSANNVKNAFAGLSPEAAHFTRFLYGMREEFKSLKEAAGKELFPKVENAITRLAEGFFPTLRTTLTQAGSSLGDFAVILSKAFTAPDFVSKFGSFFTQFYEGVRGANGELVKGGPPAEDFYNAIANVATAFIGLSEAALPLIKRFSTFIETITANWAEKTTGDTSKLTDTLNAAGDAAARVGDFLGATFGAIVALIKPAIPLGERLLDSLTNSAKGFTEFANGADGKNKLGDFFDSLEPNIRSVGRFIKILVKEFAKLGQDERVGKAFDELGKAMPTLVGVIGDFTGLAPDLIKFLDSVLAAFKKVSESEAFSTFITVLSSAFDVLTVLLDTPLGALAIGLLTVAAGFKAISLFTKFTGLKALAQIFAKGLFLKKGDAQGLKGFYEAIRGTKEESDKLSDALGTRFGRSFDLFRDKASTAKGPLGDLRVLIRDLIAPADDARRVAGQLGEALDDLQQKVRILDFKGPSVELTDFNRALRDASPGQLAIVDDVVAKLGRNIRDLNFGEGPSMAIDHFSQAVKDIPAEKLDRIDIAVGNLKDKIQNLDTGTAPSIKIDDHQVEVVDHAIDDLRRNLNTLSLTGDVKFDFKEIDTSGLHREGAKAGDLFADGLRGSSSEIGAAANDAAQEVVDRLRQNSPAKLGPLSDGGGTRGYGEKVGELFADGMRASGSDVVNAAERIAKDAADGLQVDGSAAGRKLSDDLSDSIHVDGKKIGNRIGDDVSDGVDSKRGRLKGAAGNIGEDFASDLTSGNITSLKDVGTSIMGSVRNSLEDAGTDALTGVGGKVMGKFSGEVEEGAEKAAGKGAGKFASIGGKFSKVGSSLAGAARGVGAAMSVALGPVGLIVIAIAALVAGFIYAYKHSETFKRIVNAALNKVGDAFEFLKGVVEKVFGFIKDHWNTVLAIFLPGIAAVIAIFRNWDKIKEIVGKVIDAVVDFFTGMKKRITDIVVNAKDAVVNKFTGMKNAVSDKAKAIKTSVVGFFIGMKDRIGDIATNAKNSIRDKFQAMKDAVAAKAKAIKDAVVGFFTGMKDRVGEVVTNAKNSVRDKFQNMKETLAGKAKAIKDSVVEFFQRMRESIGDKIQLAKERLDRIFGNIKDAFERVKDGIKTIWDKLKGIFNKPIDFVVNTVYNNGIRGFWNKVAGVAGLPELPAVKYATGGVHGAAHKAKGVLPGYSPGNDTVRNVSLSPGEGILVPEAVRGLARQMGMSGAAAINALNSQFTSRVPGRGNKRSQGPAFAGGGIFGSAWAAAKNGAGYVKNKVIDASEYVLGQLGKVAAKALQFIPGVMKDATPAGPFREVLGGMGNKIVDAIKGRMDRRDKQWEEEAGSGGGPDGGTAGGQEAIKQWIRRIDPLPYIWGGVGPGGYDCSGLAGEVYARHMGLPNYRRYFTTGSFPGASHGWKSGSGGTLSVGLTAGSGHVAGEYGGLRFEARSTKTGIFTGPAARSVKTFPRRYYMAAGGLVEGIGGPRDDLNPRLLSKGEFVVNAFAARRFLPFLEAINTNKLRTVNNNVTTGTQIGSVGGGGTVITLEAGALVMPTYNPVGQTSEATLNNRLRAAAELGTVSRLLTGRSE